MNAWQVWMLLKLDEVQGFLIGIGVVLILLFVALFLGTCGTTCERGEEVDVLGIFRRFRGVLIAGVLSIFAAIMMPDTKQAAVIYVAPRLIESRMVQQDLPDIYDMAIKCIKAKMMPAVEKGSKP